MIAGYNFKISNEELQDWSYPAACAYTEDPEMNTYVFRLTLGRRRFLRKSEIKSIEVLILKEDLLNMTFPKSYIAIKIKDARDKLLAAYSQK